MKYLILIGLIVMTHSSCQNANAEKTTEAVVKMKALIIDGQNNHGVWPMTTMMMKDYLEQTDLFEVDVERARKLYQGPHHAKIDGIEDIKTLLTIYPLNDGKTYVSTEKPEVDESFNPQFEDYDVVISNFGWQSFDWSENTKAAFEKYMLDGGGLIVVHAANNAWGNWDAFNKMIGLGAWGDRDTDSGPYVYYDRSGNLQVDPSDGQCGSHGPEYEFTLTTRAPDHPIMKGLPNEWLHTQDELYDRMRGPAENMTVLATAYSDEVQNSPPWDPKVKGSDRHEPMLMAIEYGKGRIFHTALGHMDYSMECVGFITTLQRGAEWAATGQVTQEIPKDFPTKTESSARTWNN